MSWYLVSNLYHASCFDGNMCVTPYISGFKWAEACSQPSWESISGCGLVFYWNPHMTGLGFLGVDAAVSNTAQWMRHKNQNKRGMNIQKGLWFESVNEQTWGRSLSLQTWRLFLFHIVVTFKYMLLPFSLNSQWSALKNLRIFSCQANLATDIYSSHIYYNRQVWNSYPAQQYFSGSVFFFFFITN